MMKGVRKGAGAPLQIGEDAIAPLGPEGIEAGLEELLVVHRPLAIGETRELYTQDGVVCQVRNNDEPRTPQVP